MTLTLAAPSADAAPLVQLPIVFRDQASRPSQLIQLVIMLPAALAILLPLGLLGARWSDLADIAADNPVATVQLLAGLGIWSILFVIPALRLIADFGWRRTVVIDGRQVTVTHTSLLRRHTLRARLDDCHGIAHLVRTTNAGPRHELVLVHELAGLRVPFHIADRIAPATISRAGALLGLPEIPGRRVLRLRQGLARTQPQAAPAERHEAIAPLAAA